MGYKYEARSSNDGNVGGSRKARASSKSMRGKSGGGDSSIVLLDAKAFAEFEKCMTTPRKPTPMMAAAAETHKAYRSKIR